MQIDYQKDCLYISFTSVGGKYCERCCKDKISETFSFYFWYTMSYLSCDSVARNLQGDIWAETAWLGFRWQYYAMISGHVYQVTDWATCQRRRFQYLQANSHNVTAKVMFVGKKQSSSQDLPRYNVTNFDFRVDLKLSLHLRLIAYASHMHFYS